ncbi:MAG TPA: aldehyde dehydrogenase family protein [Polyangiales bacterium]
MIQVVNPGTGALLAQLPEGSRDEAQAAVERARRAQPAWASLSFTQRARGLRRLARLLRDDARLLDLLTSESGKPLYEAVVFELLYTLELMRFYTSGQGRRALSPELRASFLFPNKRTRVVYHPRGVVCVIGPWNWPLLNNFADAIAPLLAGNAVVLKPSEWTPLSSLRVAELWRQAGLPQDVFQVVTGRAEAGRALVESCDMVFFTGSHAAGREVAKAAAERMIPAVLELGGKSAMIVLRDADLPRAARAAVWSGFAHSGQVCIRTERVFVEEPVADEFIALCAAETKRLQHGPAADPEVFDVGAITFPPQMTRAQAQIADAVAHGASLLSGGTRATRAGNFFPPTLLANATTDMQVMTEETFGPVLPIMRVQSAEEALQLTNANAAGLSGSVWSADAEKARALAERMQAGSVCVNDVLFNYLCVAAPLGGWKASGLGTRHGVESLRQFCRMQTVLVDRPGFAWISAVVARVFGFPYDARVLKVARWLIRRVY